MKYSYCEKLMWLAMNGVIFELLEEKSRMLIVNSGKEKQRAL